MILKSIVNLLYENVDFNLGQSRGGTLLLPGGK